MPLLIFQKNRIIYYLANSILSKIRLIKFLHNIYLCLCISLLYLQGISAQKTVDSVIQKINFISFEPETPISLIEKNELYPTYTKRTAYVLIINPHIGYYCSPNFQLGLNFAKVIVKSDFPEIQEGTGFGIGYFLRYYPKKISFNKIFQIEDKFFRARGNPYIDFEHTFFSTYRDEGNAILFSKNIKSQNLFLRFGINYYLWKQFYLSYGIGINYYKSFSINNIYAAQYFSFGYTFTKRMKK